MHCLTAITLNVYYKHHHSKQKHSLGFTCEISAILNCSLLFMVVVLANGGQWLFLF